MNNYLPLLVQNESFSQPLAATPGDTLRGRERTISTESTSNLYKPWQPQPPSGTLIIIPRFLPLLPLLPPFHAWKPGRAMFISLFFFFPSLFFSPSPPPSLSVPLPSRASRARRTPHVSRFSRHYQTTTLSTTLPPPPFRTRGKPPSPSNELRG